MYCSNVEVSSKMKDTVLKTSYASATGINLVINREGLAKNP